MLIIGSTLSGLPVTATDGTIGAVSDLLLEDDHFALRWIVVDTGGWLSAKEVLLPPASCRPDDSVESLNTDLDRRQVATSPTISADLPVARAYEHLLFKHYRMVPYWSMSTGGMTVPPPLALPLREEQAALEGNHLRSCAELHGYAIQAEDKRIGQIVDMVFASDDWSLRYVIAETGNWFSGHRVVLAPEWFLTFDFHARTGTVAMTADAIESAPPFDPQHLNADYEDALHRHYHAVHHDDS